MTLERARLWLRRRRGMQEADVSPQTPPAPVREPVLEPAQDFLQEQIRDATFRIRNLSSLGVGTGAGFAVAPHLIVTNRHVVEGADPLEVTTWDGRALEVDVAGMAQDHDLAVLETIRTLQRPLEFSSGSAREGDLIHVVGYPLGGQFSIIRGLIVDQVDGRPFEDRSHVLRVKAVVLPGYSGGPILGGQGEVVGVVYAQGRATRYALAIPASSLKRWLERAALDHLTPEQDQSRRAHDAESGA